MNATAWVNTIVGFVVVLFFGACIYVALIVSNKAGERLRREESSDEFHREWTHKNTLLLIRGWLAMHHRDGLALQQVLGEAERLNPHQLPSRGPKPPPPASRPMPRAAVPPTAARR